MSDTEDEGKEMEGEGEEQKIPDNPLVQEYVPECLSQLCKIGTGLAHAYVRFDGTNRDFTDIEHLKNFIHVRYLDLTGNLLKDISVISKMEDLLVLKVAKNNLTTAQLDALPYLQDASFADNKVENLEGIKHPLLEKLNMNSNQIASVSGLACSALKSLTVLELRGNRLTSTAGIEIPTLKKLYLAANRLTKVEGLEKLVSLEVLHLRDNQIETLEGFSEHLQKLNYINLRGNSVKSISEVQKLQRLSSLQALILLESPCTEEDNYRIEVLILLRKLERIDKEVCNEDERTEAEEVYEQRRIEESNKETMDD